MWLWLFSACTAPQLADLDPTEVLAGDTITVRGEALPEGVQLSLVGPNTARQVAPTRHSETQLTFLVPDDLQPGHWSVTLLADTWRAPEGDASFEVWHPDTEPPCVKRYALRTETSRLGRTISVDRIVPGRPTQTLRFGAEDHEALKLERSAAGCEALYLQTKDGEQILLADDAAGKLTAHAQQLAQVLELTLYNETSD